MSEHDPQAAAATYFDAWKAKDFDTLRSLLADDVTFRGPLGAADGIDACMDGLQRMAQTIEDITIDKIFVDGDDVLTWYQLHSTDTEPVATVNWSHLQDGRITAIRALFDPRPILAGNT
jgi:ketosteroid isomerase-like protein